MFGVNAVFTLEILMLFGSVNKRRSCFSALICSSANRYNISLTCFISSFVKLHLYGFIISLHLSILNIENQVFQSPEGVICFCASLHSRKDFWSAGICVEPLRSRRSYPQLNSLCMTFDLFIEHLFS